MLPGIRLNRVSKGDGLPQIAEAFVTRLDRCASGLRHVGRGKTTPTEQRVQARCNAVSLVTKFGLPVLGARLYRRGRLRVHATIEPSDGETSVQSSSGWNSVTAKLVSAATVVFFFLLVPQIVKNAVNLQNSDVAALTAIAWVGYISALLGNTMLLSYFLGRDEDGGALIQAVGAFTNVVILSQVYIAGCMPSSVFYATGALVILAAALSGLKWRGGLRVGSGRAVWDLWNDFLGLVGVSSLIQAAASTFAGIESSRPGVAGLALAAAVLLLDRTEKLPDRWQGVWEGVPAWSATLLFAFQPVAQLVRNFTAPDSLAGLSQVTVLLAIVGNGLMVPRALHTRDRVWLAGSGWASLTGWLQLLSLFLSRNPHGARYLGLPPFAAATVLFVVYTAAVLHRDMADKSLPLSPSSVTKLMSQR